MSELSEIREMLINQTKDIQELKGEFKTHVAETKVYRENQTNKDEDYKGTLYARPGGLIYEVEALKENAKQNAKHKTWMATLFGVPIAGWMIQSLFEFLSRK